LISARYLAAGMKKMGSTTLMSITPGLDGFKGKEVGNPWEEGWSRDFLDHQRIASVTAAKTIEKIMTLASSRSRQICTSSATRSAGLHSARSSPRAQQQGAQLARLSKIFIK